MAVKKPASLTTKRMSCLVTKKPRRQQTRKILPKAEMLSLTMYLDNPNRNPKKSKPGHVYVFCEPKNPFYVKIGCSNNPDVRVEQLKVEFSMPTLKVMHVSKEVAHPRRVESSVHEHLDEIRDHLHYTPPYSDEEMESREWFRVYWEDAKHIVDHWATYCG